MKSCNEIFFELILTLSNLNLIFYVVCSSSMNMSITVKIPDRVNKVYQWKHRNVNGMYGI